MATSLTSVSLPRNVFVDIYAATGIATGTALIIQNTGSTRAKLYEHDSSPGASVGFHVVDKGEFVGSATTPIGVWAMSTGNTTLQVEEA